jgi:hypothetical protein
MPSLRSRGCCDETLPPFCLTAVLWAAFSWPAQAQQNQCQPRGSMLSLFANKYKEAPIARGVTNLGGLLEVLSTKDGDTWTIILTSPKGTTCLVSSGTGWVRRAIEGEES